MTRRSPEGAFSAEDALPRQPSQELRESSRRGDIAPGSPSSDVHEAVGVLNAFVVEHGGKEECKALAVLLNALRAADEVSAQTA